MHYRKEDHQCVRPVIIVKGKKQKDMKNKEDYYDVVEIVPGDGSDAEAGRVRLQARRLHLSSSISTPQALPACGASFFESADRAPVNRDCPS